MEFICLCDTVQIKELLTEKKIMGGYQWGNQKT